MANEADPKHRQCEACSLTSQPGSKPHVVPTETPYPERPHLSACRTASGGVAVPVHSRLFQENWARKPVKEQLFSQASFWQNYVLFVCPPCFIVCFIRKTIILLWNKICFRPRIWGRGSYNYVKKRAALNSFWKEWSVRCSSVAELCLLRPHGLLACQASGACSNSHPLSQWCHPAVSSSVIPFSSCLQSFPASGSFPMSWLFVHIRWPKYWSFNFSISPSSEYSGLISFKYIYTHTQRHEQKLWAEKGVRSSPLKYVHSQAVSAALQELRTNSPRGCLRLFPQRPPKDPARLPGSGYLI